MENVPTTITDFETRVATHLLLDPVLQRVQSTIADTVIALADDNIACRKLDLWQMG